MRKTVLFLIGLIVAGGLSYFAGYYLYVTNRPKVVLETPELVQKGILLQENSSGFASNYYLAKIEEGILNIYHMPEEILYDSLGISGLQLQETDYKELEKGKVFMDLPEVFEFLENCMS